MEWWELNKQKKKSTCNKLGWCFAFPWWSEFAVLWIVWACQASGQFHDLGCRWHLHRHMTRQEKAHWLRPAGCLKCSCFSPGSCAVHYSCPRGLISAYGCEIFPLFCPFSIYFPSIFPWKQQNVLELFVDMRIQPLSIFVCFGLTLTTAKTLWASHFV